MRETIVSDILLPLLRRAGTFMAGGLVAYGLTEQDAVSFVEAVTTIALVLSDLYWSRKNRKGK